MKNGLFVILSEGMKKEQLRKWRKTEQFFCPQCDQPVQLKVGEIIIPHFAHLKDDACETTFSEGETQDHLRGKQQLYSFFQQRTEQVHLEPYLTLLAQRPDLLVFDQEKRIPIEFQCSAIPILQKEERTAGYEGNGMQPIWILRTPVNLAAFAEGLGVFTFSKFQESFFTKQSPEGIVFLTYNPNTMKFHYFSSLIHISGKRYIGIHRTLSLENQVFPFARPKPPTVQEIHRYVDIYMDKRKKFLQTCILWNKKGVNHRFLRDCYEMRLHPTKLPHWIGLPVSDQHYFKQHDCEWQLALNRYLRRQHVGIEGLSESLAKKFTVMYGDGSRRQIQACIAYQDVLNVVRMNSSQNGEDESKRAVFHLLAERFLAKRYEN
ncbi:hypothetical protein AU377_09870 [Sporosarcina sp. HYO08]|nr:competence protein CoiA family protein [Sporosarcina sp. HYO08]KXH79785.1 hypothetical protein AU377_09870 [Sporosarcina sp. HYO08]